MTAGTGRYAAIHFVAKSRRRQTAVTMEHKSGNIGNRKSGLYPMPPRFEILCFEVCACRLYINHFLELQRFNQFIKV
jgi:hypothetical protein